MESDNGLRHLRQSTQVTPFRVVVRSTNGDRTGPRTGRIDSGNLTTNLPTILPMELGHK